MFMSLRLSFALFLGVAIAYPAANAADNTRYVSITGNNTNPCTLAQPCRALQRGINATPAGGELRILDSGFYGNNANIKRSMTITGNGNTVSLGGVLTINKAGATVTLRRLVLDGQGSTQHGVHILAATAVHIEHCVVHSFTNDGIRLDNASAALFVTDSVSRDNGQIGLFASSISAEVTVDNSRFERNGNIGILLVNTESTITRSISSSNANNGIHAQGGRMNVTSTTSSQNFHGFVVNNSGDLVLESSVARGNTSVGLYVFSGTGTVSNSVFTHNDTGIYNNSQTVLTRLNNVVIRNSDDVFGTLTTLNGT